MPTEVERLLSALAERTERGELLWQRQASDVEGFILSLKAGEVSIVCDDNDGTHPYTVTLRSGEAPEQSWNSVNYTDEELMLTPYGRLLARLFLTASRSASGATRLVNDMLREIAPDDLTV